MSDQTPANDPLAKQPLSAAESEQVDAWISERLDQTPADWTETDFGDFEQAPLAMRRRVAEWQWLHGLLLQSSRQDDPSNTELIQTTLKALPNQPGEPQTMPAAERARGRTSAWRRWLVAAVVLFGVGLVWQIGNGPSSAYAAVEQALLVAAEYRDRQYTVVAELQSPAGRVRKIESQLYVRGLNEFVLDHPGLLPGARIWIGADGHQYWVMPAVGPVWVSQENGPVKEWLDQFQVTTPYLQLTTILTRLRDRYTLQDAQPESLDSTTEEAVPQKYRHIQGTLHNGHSSPVEAGSIVPPARIDLHVDPRSGEVRRLTLDWSAAQNGPFPGLQRVTFDLANFAHQPDDWYQHRGHHKNNRRILQMPPVK